MSSDTIVAPATPPGRGGVAVIRLSGPKSLAIAKTLAKKTAFCPRKACFSKLEDSKQQLIDTGIIVYFPAPHSFTGEEVIEMHSHGSPVVVEILVEECLFLGARIARPGEFSERAFLNNKMDLVQAEAIADLINASSKQAARLALKSLTGDFSKAIEEINQAVIYLRLFIEASLDFSEEAIDHLSETTIQTQLNQTIDKLNQIKIQASQGALLREGFTVVIAGSPNAGKSTLINALAKREVAIVTDIPGTTRDVLRQTIILEGLPLEIIDTAGIRKSTDPIEQEGINRAWQEINKADCILIIQDINQSNPGINLNVDKLPAVPVIEIINKIDNKNLFPKIENNKIWISAKQKQGLDLLTQLIQQTLNYQPQEAQFLARRRHLEALENAHRYLDQAQSQWSSDRALELFAEDLRLAHQALGEITGEYTNEDLLGNIFSNFCIGK